MIHYCKRKAMENTGMVLSTEGKWLSDGAEKTEALFS